ncbi:thiolase family protein, partial [Mycobacterium avium]
ARTPIGRAFKGSLTTARADDLCVAAITAAMHQVPEVTPHSVNDLIVGCGAPGGEQGFNIARVVAVLLGWDDVPATTVTRYCASSLQAIRMATHAIKAGEGHTFVVAGVETVSRSRRGT